MAGVLSLPNLSATKGATRDDQRQAYTLTWNEDGATYGNSVTVGPDLAVNVAEKRETIALTAHAAMLVHYADWVSIPAHDHPTLASEPD